MSLYRSINKNVKSLKDLGVVNIRILSSRMTVIVNCFIRTDFFVGYYNLFVCSALLPSSGISRILKCRILLIFKKILPAYNIMWLSFCCPTFQWPQRISLAQYALIFIEAQIPWTWYVLADYVIHIYIFLSVPLTWVYYLHWFF